jgi:putative solute:sodium symporter small subunit
LIAADRQGTVPPAKRARGETVQKSPEPSDAGKPRRRHVPILALLVWALLVLAVPRLVEPLNIVDVLAFPLGFFMTAQGSLLALLVLAILSARHHDKLAAGGDE